jgi:hypothetical protein
MSEKNTMAFGIFPDRMSIETVVTTLKREGFQSGDVSILFRENRGTWEQTNAKTSKGFATSKATSTTVGSSHGALRWLSGIGAIAIPGQGTFVAVGPVRASLEGTAFGGVHGALAGSLIGMGVPEYQAKRYEMRLSGSWFLLSVRYSDPQQMTKAKRILEETFAEDVLSTDESHSEIFNSNRSMPGIPAVASAGMRQSFSSR